MKFDYLLEKVRAGGIAERPFKHLQINDFLSEQHFKEITTAHEIALEPQQSDDALFDVLFKNGYKVIDFPGCITDKAAYLEWHRKKAKSQAVSTACEGFGMTLRMMEPKSKIVSELMAFLGSEEWKAALADRFGVAMSDVIYDAGIQKYLDGYEISPHPDIRRKALTFMVNINPGTQSETSDHHTHYMTFKDGRKYVQAYWAGNPKMDRCWVPWGWCETQKVQNENNSIVIFAPGNDTLHAVRANYDHLIYQRTQLYGNFWYHKSPVDGAMTWEDFAFQSSASPLKKHPSFVARLSSKVRRLVRSRSAQGKASPVATNYYKRDL